MQHNRFRALYQIAAAITAAACAAQPIPTRAERVVVLKVDGLPLRLVEQYLSQAAEGKARSGRSSLPWIDYVFANRGVRFQNFYTRGLSLSAPSWSLLDTGRPLEIRGNVEYDRYTLRAYDYLNFFPFYLGYAKSERVDTRGVEVLDEVGVPLLLDRFPFEQRYQGFQLLQRGARWTTLESSLRRALSKAPKDLLDEWMTGISMSESFNRQNEAELLLALQDPNVKYLDYFTGEYDHTAHLTADPVSQFHALEEIDALVGRVWNAITKSPLADSTALILVSDHGMNTSPTVISQGYNLVDWFNSRAGGAHHVLTNRHPMTEFKLKGLDPFVTSVITPSTQATYLSGQSDPYPTVMLDLDGNERASIGLRNNTFNILQILLDQLINRRFSGPARVAILSAFFNQLEGVRIPWERDLADLSATLTQSDRKISAFQNEIGLPSNTSPKKKKWTAPQKAKGLDKEFRRKVHLLETWQEERKAYAQYASTLRRLLALTPADFDPGKFKLTELIPPRSLGPPNSVYDLQHYVTGPGPNGLAQSADGQLDLDRSFTTTNYFTALADLNVRNNVQSGVAAKPVDFTAIRLASVSLPASFATSQDAIWLHHDPQHQALILSRPSAEGQQLKYVPIRRLQAQADGSVALEVAQWGPDFPLHIYEDAALALPGGASKNEWLGAWHSEAEWFRSVRNTRYSNGIIGLTEQLLDHSPSSDAYQERKHQLRRADLLVLANDHWNFNVRGFNPGGNHGSFLQESTRSTLMVAGGKNTGIPAGQTVDTPYDSLSFVPTVLSLMGRAEPELPGPVMVELQPSSKK